MSSSRSHRSVHIKIGPVTFHYLVSIEKFLSFSMSYQGKNLLDYLFFDHFSLQCIHFLFSTLFALVVVSMTSKLGGEMRR